MEHFNSKVLLFGEYAVLHNGMALVIPCDKYQGHFDFYKTTEKNQNALQSNEFLKRFCTFVSSHIDERFVLEVKLFEKELEQGLFFSSNIPQGYGLGSSGALVAAIVLRYLVKAKNLKDELKILTFQKLKELKSNLSDLESFFHGVSSGLDPLSIILNEPILYNNAQDIVTTQLPKSSLEKKNYIFLLDTKLPRTTSKMMSRFNELYSQDEFRDLFNEHDIKNNNEAIQSFLKGDTDHFYRSIYDLSAFQLKYMSDFFPPTLRDSVASGLESGNYFLKLCGAGGGGFMLGFTKDWDKAQDQLKDYQLEEIYSY